ncbi:phospholipase D family protein [Variovorax terrae]|uniref:Phospholipase D family protein n=1 Tax=Variovorax terrae TaxID=2923278 RepID=A0A9X1VUX9_9BURK|nr:phospholipase D family protein [Variovorax terrae]MCJ0763689.1 phospholipase D family protein [Variovorax terrae]
MIYLARRFITATLCATRAHLSRAARIGALLLATTLAACGSLPAQMPRTASNALPAADTALAKTARASIPAEDQTGVRLLPLGVYSLDARIELIQRAQQSLDLQYYVIEGDSSGRLLLGSLRDAALRGVRVRLLVDDLHTASTQSMLRAMAALPRVEVRLFNPFCCARGNIASRFMASLTDFSRLNRRMHNKLFIADGAMAIVGGRNIADEYFTRNPLQNFLDMDAFLIGAVVPQLQAIFDRYWNSEQAYPVETIVGTRSDGDQLQQDLAKLLGMEKPSQPLQNLPPVDVLGYGPISEELETGRIGLVWGTGYAYADPPNKVTLADDDEARSTSVTLNVMDSVQAAQTEVVLMSPYLVPGREGMRVMKNLRSNGVNVTILTNSLAASDSPLVHTGYARYRVGMLKDGVDLYELSAMRAATNKRLGLNMFGTSSRGLLHAKTVVIDRRTVFVGSMNLDPRSASQNTELGILIDSPPLAREMLRIINISKLQSAYRLRLSPAGTIEWLTLDNDHEVVLTSEPETTFLMRLHNFLLSPLVPEQLL